MSYQGTTAATSVANVPTQLIGGLGGFINSTAFGVGGQAASTAYGNQAPQPKLWIYTSSHSATEASSGTNSGAFFADAWSMGMRTGDVMMMVGCTGSSLGIAIGVLTVANSSGAYMSTGAQVSSTFN